MLVETERLVLRPVTESDVDFLVELDSDPRVMRFLTGGDPTPRAEVVQKMLRPGRWAAIERATGEFVGWFALVSTGEGEAELGYRLRAASWGRGYATEGSKALVDKGFADGLRRVWAQTMAVNTASRRVMERSGLVYVRTFHLDWDDPIDGTEHGEVEYALTVDAYWSARAR
ncbi:GNAT family N-acetyltransferase [Actinocrispum wychmicini]|uniref:RimJ/RimL family protein N-acetyltransferase n=1 Tax=Actinocrispum wychmicini TaxID=1213861 RepID=A0A4R2J4C7_9PSEU|nr:GNAT family N-acetyltransferase [Actinocrispum wychmicini]TCO52607.1 RimJ/RimL family protein N-acetyltransferase [Actinocrispum wychmicini]